MPEFAVTTYELFAVTYRVSADHAADAVVSVLVDGTGTMIDCGESLGLCEDLGLSLETAPFSAEELEGEGGSVDRERTYVPGLSAVEQVEQPT